MHFTTVKYAETGLYHLNFCFFVYFSLFPAEKEPSHKICETAPDVINQAFLFCTPLIANRAANIRIMLTGSTIQTF